MLNVRKLSIESVDIRGQRVLLRAGFNVPCSDGKVTDTYRLAEGAETIKVCKFHVFKYCLLF